MQWSSGGWLLSEKAISDAAKQQCNIAAQLSLLAYDFTYLLIAGSPDVGELVYLLIQTGRVLYAVFVFGSG